VLAVQYAWSGYLVSRAAAGALGILLLGRSALAAGRAIVASRAMPRLLGWPGIVMGAARALTVLATGTGLAAAACLPAPVLAVVLRLWARDRAVAGPAAHRPDSGAARGRPMITCPPPAATVHL
jgi:hypothetical protein